MSERKTPLCPMLMQANTSIRIQARDGTPSKRANGLECLGSRCAWWVPKTYTIENTLKGAMFQCIPMRDNSQGICAKNEHADPWPDPATTKENQP